MDFTKLDEGNAAATIDILHQSDADVQNNARTPLHFAYIQGHLDNAQIMLQHSLTLSH